MSVSEEYVHSASLPFLCLPSLEMCLSTSSLEVFLDSLYGSGSVFWHAVGKLSVSHAYKCFGSNTDL